jgi:hypothetical protein
MYPYDHTWVCPAHRTARTCATFAFDCRLMRKEGGDQSASLYSKVAELASSGNTPAVNPELFIVEGKAEYRNDEEVFRAIAQRLRDSVLAVVFR